eukprot:910561-Rhodomonas_salina.2
MHPSHTISHAPLPSCLSCSSAPVYALIKFIGAAHTLTLKHSHLLTGACLCRRSFMSCWSLPLGWRSSPSSRAAISPSSTTQIKLSSRAKV